MIWERADSRDLVVSIHFFGTVEVVLEVLELLLAGVRKEIFNQFLLFTCRAVFYARHASKVSPFEASVVLEGNPSTESRL